MPAMTHPSTPCARPGLATPVLLLISLATGCARSAATSSSPAQEPAAAPAPADEELPPSTSELPPAKPGPCAEGGRLWDGKPQDCSYEHGGCCYGSPATACAAAGCSEDQCQVLESYPAQIMCTTAPEGDCQVRHDGRCYATREAACEAAGCPLDRCALNKSNPATIACSER